MSRFKNSHEIVCFFQKCPWISYLGRLQLELEKLLKLGVHEKMEQNANNSHMYDSFNPVNSSIY